MALASSAGALHLALQVICLCKPLALAGPLTLASNAALRIGLAGWSETVMPRPREFIIESKTAIP